MAVMFTLDQARALVPQLVRHVNDLAVVRADLADAQAALRRGERPPQGGMAEAKALEARLAEAVDWFAERHIELKGIAPVIADLPAELGGEVVLLCWLEGEESLDWYHAPEVGFMGRRRLPDAPPLR